MSIWKKYAKTCCKLKMQIFSSIYKCEINNGGFDRFILMLFGYEVFEVQKKLEFFGLIEKEREKKKYMV